MTQPLVESSAASKLLDDVPSLAWGRGRDCTFCGALEAALAATAHPCAYVDLMGWSALAFRTRCSKWDDKPFWCNSASVGEFPEETKRIEQTTGWRFRHAMHWGEDHRERFTNEIVASIDAGRPVVGYGRTLDVSVACGYQDGGARLLWRDYDKPEEFLPVPAEKIGPWWMFLDRYEAPLPPRAALRLALSAALVNWRQEHGSGEGDNAKYWYGKSALDAWTRDLGLDDATLDQALKDKLFCASRFNYLTLVDARGAAARFLRANADLATDDARTAMLVAADLFESEVALLNASPPSRWCRSSFGDWSAAGRAEQKRLLEQACEIEERAFDGLGELPRRIA